MTIRSTLKLRFMSMTREAETTIADSWQEQSDLPGGQQTFHPGRLRNLRHVVYIHVDAGYYWNMLWQSLEGRWGNFRILSDNTIDSSYTLSAPSPWSGQFGDETLGATITAKQLSVGLTSDLHMLVRTTDFNPADEVWLWGDLSLNALIDVEAEAFTSLSGTFGPVNFAPIPCVLPLCVGATLAGIAIEFGSKPALDVEAKAKIDAKVALAYKRAFSSQHNFAHSPSRRGITAALRPRWEMFLSLPYWGRILRFTWTQQSVGNGSELCDRFLVSVASRNPYMRSIWCIWLLR